MATVAELLKQKDELEKKLKLARAKESNKERTDRARKLIQIGSFFFGLDYEAVHLLIEKKDSPSPIATELQKKVADYLKLKGIISEKRADKNEKPDT